MTTDYLRSVGILADDLTSAADGAGPFVARGLQAIVARGAPAVRDCSVVAVDCGSRSATEVEVIARVTSLTRQIADRAILYKTVDSTLRGHVRAELGASFAVSRRRRLVFAPAFPAAGRTTVGGVQLVNGVPVSETIYGRDVVHPARTSALADLVPPAIERAILLNASTQEELDTQVAALPEPEGVLWVGSPGLAEALARRIASDGAQCHEPAMARPDILVGIGTANPLSHRQARAIEALEGVEVLRAPCAQDHPARVLARIAEEAAERLRNSVGALIATGGDTMEAILERLNLREFEILGEFEPGFPVGRATLARCRPLLIAMKAGGFGEEETLHRAIARLRGAPILRKGTLS